MSLVAYKEEFTSLTSQAVFDEILTDDEIVLCRLIYNAYFSAFDRVYYFLHHTRMLFASNTCASFYVTCILQMVYLFLIIFLARLGACKVSHLPSTSRFSFWEISTDYVGLNYGSCKIGHVAYKSNVGKNIIFVLDQFTAIL